MQKPRMLLNIYNAQQRIIQYNINSAEAEKSYAIYDPPHPLLNSSSTIPLIHYSATILGP